MTDTQVATVGSAGTPIVFENAPSGALDVALPPKAPVRDAAFEAAVAAARAQLVPSDAASVATWGAPVMGSVDAVSRDLVGHARSGDAGTVGLAMERLVLQLKGYDVSDVESGQRVLDRVKALFGRARLPIEVMRVRYDEINEQIDASVRTFDDDIGRLMRSQVASERLFGVVAKAFVDLQPYEEAARRVVSELRDERRPALVARAGGGDQLAAAEVLRLDGQASAVGGRQADFAKAGAMIHTILVIVANTMNDQREVVAQGQSTVSMTVPMWRLKCAVALQQDELARVGARVSAARAYDAEQSVALAKMARRSSGLIAKEAERGAVDMSAVREATNETIRMLEDGAASARRRVARQDADIAEADACVVALQRAMTGAAFATVQAAKPAQARP